MNETNQRIQENLDTILTKHNLTLKNRTPTSAFADHVTVNECGAEFSICDTLKYCTVFHSEGGGWMGVGNFTTEEILAL